MANVLFALNIKKITQCIFLYFLLAGSLLAGTVIESRDMEGRINKLTVNGEKIRMEVSDSGYMLIDLYEKKFYTIEPDEKRIIDMSSFYARPQTKNTEDRINVQFKKIGKGPMIAGYTTTHYKMMINDFVCADEYLSRSAYTLADVKTLFKAYAHMSGREAAMGVSGDGDPCERVEFEMSAAQYSKLGIPMKTVSRDGHIDHEITAIKKNAKVSKKLFKLPISYTTLSVENLYKLME